MNLGVILGINNRAWELLRGRATHSLFSLGQAKKLWWADCMRKAYKEAHPSAVVQIRAKLAAKKVRAKSGQKKLF